MNPTHDFISPMSKKEIPIKLIEIQEGVKLEINYTRATEEMILKNDAKMTNVEKKDIKKCLVLINVDELQGKVLRALIETSAKEERDEELVNSSMISLNKE